MNVTVVPLAMSIISLNCLIHGEVSEKMFTVEVEKTKNVSILKKLIKEEKAPHLEHVAASDLDLWMNSEQNRCMSISIPIQSYHHARYCQPFSTML
jgi:hypothetical protein